MKKLLRKSTYILHRFISDVSESKGYIGAFTLLVSLLTISTTFFHMVEGWSYIDALYFSVMTITTVGYGDLHPTTDVSKIFAMVLVFLGVGLGIVVTSNLAATLIDGRKKRVVLLHKLIEKIKDVSS